MIRKSNRNRYRSAVILISLRTFDILITLRDQIMQLLPLFVPMDTIPISCTVLILTIVLFGLAFGLSRVMLLNRYKLPQNVVF